MRWGKAEQDQAVSRQPAVCKHAEQVWTLLKRSPSYFVW